MRLYEFATSSFNMSVKCKAELFQYKCPTTIVNISPPPPPKKNNIYFPWCVVAFYKYERQYMHKLGRTFYFTYFLIAFYWSLCLANEPVSRRE